MTGSGEPPARASDADRDRAVRLLRDAIVDGRLSQDTFVRRVDRALRARDQNSLSELVADLRPDPSPSPPTGWRRGVSQLVSPSSFHPALPLPDRNRPVLVIGRRPNCDVHLSDKRVSRVHAVLMLFEGSWYVEDLQSTNGTYVNGTRILQRAAVGRGDTVSFAGTHFRLSRPVTGSSLPWWARG